MLPKVYWLVTLNMPSAAIALCTSTGSTPARKLPSAWPRSMTRASRSMIGRLSVRIAFDFCRWRPLAWFSATTRRTKPSCADVVVVGELDDAAHRVHRRQVVEVELAFGLADLGVHVLEHREVELLLAAEVVVDQRARGVGARGDGVHARALEAARGELVDGRGDDAGAVGLGRLGLAHRRIAAARLGSWN